MFDIRDMEIDRDENIRTIPVLAGVKKAYGIAYILLIVFVILSFVQHFKTPDLLQLNAMLVSAGATLLMVEYTKKNTSDFVYLACIDGMMLLQASLVIIGSI